jgi:hypothetical protein
MTLARRAWLLLTAALIAGCGRDGGTAGIDGTGAPVIVAHNRLSYGTVAALGSVWVNNTRYDTATAVIVIDGTPGTEADIQTGDVVLVSARTDPNNVSRLVADRVTVDDAVEGPITAVDAANSSLVALGQTVRITPATAFDEAVVPASLAGLVVGESIEVAGFRGSNGDVIATRIEKKPAGTFETTGAVASLDVAAQRFMIGALEVEYAGVATTAIRNGDIVEAKGSVLLPGGALVASAIQRMMVVTGSSGDRVDIEGYVTAFDERAPQAFDVAGVPARITPDTIVSDVNLGLDAKVGVAGSLDTAGEIVASDVRRGFSPAPPSGSASPYTVLGQLFEVTSGPIRGAPINLWVQQSSGGYSYWWANGALYSNARGEFLADHLPPSEIMIHAGHGPWVQPCAVIVRVPGAAYQHIELFPGAAFENTLTPPRPQLVQGTALNGSVFEVVNGARQPVPGVLVWAYTGLEIDIASTRTDLNGRFFLCNLPQTVDLVADKDGYAMRSVAPVDMTAPVEIEMQRNQ